MSENLQNGPQKAMNSPILETHLILQWNTIICGLNVDFPVVLLLFKKKVELVRVVFWK